jgi:hypothetical protein
VTLTATEEILQAAIGDANQPFVVAVQIIGVTGEAGVDRLNSGAGIARQSDAIRRHSGAHHSAVVSLLDRGARPGAHVVAGGDGSASRPWNFETVPLWTRKRRHAGLPF